MDYEDIIAFFSLPLYLNKCGLNAKAANCRDFRGFCTGENGVACCITKRQRQLRFTGYAVFAVPYVDWPADSF